MSLFDRALDESYYLVSFGVSSWSELFDFTGSLITLT